MPICRRSGRGSATAIGSTAPGNPRRGHRFNPAKLLLDPYAKAIDGSVRWSDTLFGYQIGHPDADLARDDRDSAAGMPKSVVIDPAFTWGADRAPRIPWNESLIYEVHVKGFTARHPDVPKPLRGTYAGLSAPAVRRLPDGPRHHRGGADAHPPFRRRQASGRPRARELLGLQLDRLLRSRHALLGRGRARPAGRRVQDDGQAVPRRGHRGHPRRGLQPHRGGQPSRADPLLSAASTTPPTTGSPRRTGATTWTTPAAATRST